jgi:hypothetical protein
LGCHRCAGLRLHDFTDESWKEVAPQLKQVQAEAKALGWLVSLTLVDRSEEGGNRSYRYRMEFEKSTLLQHLVFDPQNKVVSSRTEDIR